MGSTLRMPGVLAASSSDPIEQACPMHIVATCSLRYYIVSRRDDAADAAMRLDAGCHCAVGLGVR